MNFLTNLLMIVRSLKTRTRFSGLIGWMTALVMLDVDSLPDDPKLLKTLLAEYVQKYHEAQRYAEGLEHAITQLRRMHFGPNSQT